MKVIDRLLPDNFFVGLIQGVIVPCLVVLLLLSFGTVEWTRNMFASKAFVNLFVKMVSLSVLPNLGLFYLYINRNYYRGGKGVIVATLIIAFFVFLVKFILSV